MGHPASIQERVEGSAPGLAGLAAREAAATLPYLGHGTAKPRPMIWGAAEEPPERIAIPEFSPMVDTNTARILDVGQCGPDHHSIRSFLQENFFAEVDRADTIDEALGAMRTQHYDLVLVNRMIDSDGSDGLELIRQAKREELSVPIMLVSNYADAQSAAVAAGALPGFGKASLYQPLTHEHLTRILPVKNVGAPGT